MSPFIKHESLFNDENEPQKNVSREREDIGDFDVSDIDINISADKFQLDSSNEAVFSDNKEKKTIFFDKKNTLILLGIIIVFLSACICFLYQSGPSNGSDDIEELPIIKAEPGPIKQVVESENKTSDSQKIYSYITNTKDEEKIEQAVNSEIKYSNVAADVPDYSQEASQDTGSENTINNEEKDISSPSKDIRLEKKKSLRAAIKRVDEVENNYTPAKHKKSLKNFFKKKKGASDAEQMSIFIPFEVYNTEIKALDEYDSLVREHAFLRGYSYKVVKTGSGKGVKYKLLFGPFASVELADKAADRMRAVGLRVVW